MVASRGKDSGQAVIEYVLLLAASVSFYFIVVGGITRIWLGARLMRPLTQDFARTYRYGLPNAKGYDDGGPEHHPRAFGGNNFRLFINPDGKKDGP